LKFLYSLIKKKKKKKKKKKLILFFIYYLYIEYIYSYFIFWNNNNNNNNNKWINSEVRVINIPIKDYDLINKNVLLRSNLIVLSALTFTHVCFGWTRPLLLQVYFPIKLLYVHPLIRVHVFQSEAKGQLARPWDMYSRVPLSTLG